MRLIVLLIVLIASGCTVYKYDCSHLKPLPTKTKYWFDGINHHYRNPNGTGVSTNISGQVMVLSDTSTFKYSIGFHSEKCKCATCEN